MTENMRETYDQLGRSLIARTESLREHMLLTLVGLVLDGMITAFLLAVVGKLGRLGVHAFNFTFVIPLQSTLGGVSGLEGLLRLLQRSRLMRVRCTHHVCGGD